MDTKAQGTVMTALIFFIIMLVVSAGIYAYGSTTYDAEEERFEDLDTYVRAYSEAYMRTTLVDVFMVTNDSSLEHRPPGTTQVEELLLEEIYLLHMGESRWAFHSSAESNIAVVGRSLCPDGHYFILSVEYGNETNGTSRVYIGTIGSIMTESDAAAFVGYREVVYHTWTRSMSPFGLAGETEFALALWSD